MSQHSTHSTTQQQQQRHDDTAWLHTGSSVSGNGYGYSIYRDRADRYGMHAVHLSFGRGTHTALVPTTSFTAASQLGERFCDAWRAWQRTQARAEGGQ